MAKDLIDLLDDLRVALDKSGVERTTGLKYSMGLDCHYYRKSKQLFLERDYDKLKELVELVNKQFQLLEGPKK